METLLIKSEKLKIEVEIKQQVNSDDSNTEYRECEGSDSHQEVDSHDQDLLMVLLCYHFIKLFTSFFIGRGSSWKREEGPICKPCVSTRGPPIADSTASDTTIAEDTMIDEFPQDEEADVNQYISVWRSY